MHYDTIISARWIITVEQDGEVLENHAIAIKDGRIAQILPSAQCAAWSLMKPSTWTTMY
jgi:5-methylthioadenosine/S-adenosylhomocysteine deaminase